MENEYRIVTANSPLALEVKVNKLLQEKWLTSGGVTAILIPVDQTWIKEYLFMQSMIKIGN